MKRVRLVVGALLLSLGWSTQVQALDYSNFGFEAGNLEGWESIGDVDIRDANIQDFTVTPAEGGSQAYLYNGSITASISELETFLAIAPGTINSIAPGDAPIAGSALKRQLTLTSSAGSVLSFAFNFITSEIGVTPSYKDFAFVSLSPSQVATLADASATTFIPIPENYNQQLGYRRFSVNHSLAAGDYTLGFAVIEAGDASNPSALLVDDVQVVPVPWEPDGLGIGAALGGTSVVIILRRMRKNQ